MVPPHLRQNHPQDLPPEPAPEARPEGAEAGMASEDPKSLLNTSTVGGLG